MPHLRKTAKCHPKLSWPIYNNPVDFKTSLSTQRFMELFFSEMINFAVLVDKLAMLCKGSDYIFQKQKLCGCALLA